MSLTPSIPLLTLSVIAAAALSANRFVTGTGAVPGAGASCLGVTRTSASTGDLTPIDVLGTTEVEAGGTVTAGSAVMVDASGRVLDKTSTNVVVGRALTGTTTVGAFVEVFLIPNA